MVSFCSHYVGFPAKTGFDLSASITEGIMQTKKIFLASSEELREDRIAFELMIGQLNQEWVPRGTFFHLVVWENFIDAMSKEGLQHEYNKAIRGCDIFVLLFFRKLGLTPPRNSKRRSAHSGRGTNR